MPLWHIYCPENAYSAEDKCTLATRITDLYADVGLPRFYASVVFHELPKNSFFVGGKATNDFVRIWIDQIARATAPERRAWWLERVNTRSILSHASGAIAGRSTLTKHQSISGPSKG